MNDPEKLFEYLKSMPEACESLKQRPYIHQRIKELWGRPEFFPFTESLLINEPGREVREGLEQEIYREITNLRHAFARYPDIVSLPTLTIGERMRVNAEINKQKTKVFSF